MTSSTAVLKRLRAICEELPGVEERLSHGTPAFFVRGRMFAQLWDDHHAYVGHRGWLGVRLDRGPDWERIAQIVRGAHATVTGR